MKHKRTTELRYPGLWRGCVGAWAPCLGPTGLTLRDWSGLKNHGTLTNGPTWSPSIGKHSVRCDGTNDYILIPYSPQLETRTAYSYVVDCVYFGGQSDAMFYGKNASGGYYNTFGIVPASRRLVVYKDNAFHMLSNGSVTIGKRSVVALTFDGSTLSMWIDGVIDKSQSSTPYTATSNGFSIGGTPGYAGGSTQCDVFSVHHYSRALSSQEIALHSSRPGIAYEMAPRRRSSSGIAFNRRRRLLVGA